MNIEASTRNLDLKGDDCVRRLQLPNPRRLLPPLHTLECQTTEMSACLALVAEGCWSNEHLAFETAGEES